MTRILTDHKVNPANDVLTITVNDEPGAGGAHHDYVIQGFERTFKVETTVGDGPEPAVAVPEATTTIASLQILFQDGPINEVGVNGVTHEALLAILIDRLRCFQAGPYACRENALALTNLEQAQHWLHYRTLQRMQRGVEGTHGL